MKTYNEISKEEQNKAIQYELNEILEYVTKGMLRFDGKLQKRIDAAWKEMEDLQTPWFIGERLMEDRYIVNELTSMATIQAKDNLYLEEEENAVKLCWI